MLAHNQHQRQDEKKKLYTTLNISTSVYFSRWNMNGMRLTWFFDAKFVIKPNQWIQFENGFGIEIGTNATYCRSLRCCRFFLNAFFTRKIKNAARSMDNDGGFFSSPLFSAFSFLSPFSYVFFVVPSFIVWPSRVWRTQAPSEFTFTVTQLIMIIFTLFCFIYFLFCSLCQYMLQWHISMTQ